MRISCLGLILVAILLLTIPLAAQQPAPRDPQGSALLSQALANLGGRIAVNDVTLTGTANRIAGSDNELGAATLKATAVGQSRIDLALPSGTRSEVRDISQAPPGGIWSGPDGVAHAIALHNLLVDPTWPFPSFAISRVISTPSYAISYVGRENRANKTVDHLTVYQQAQSQSEADLMIQHLTQTDIFLDSAMLLPVAVAFNTHSDDDAGLDIPVEIDFSDYRVANGLQVPFHVQTYLNNGLTLDLQFQTAAFNSGIPASTFSVP